MANNTEIFEIYSELKKIVARAEAHNLENVKSVLAYASDLLVKEYHKSSESPASEASELSWDEEQWPGATAVLLEMKSMIQNMEKANVETKQVASSS